MRLIWVLFGFLSSLSILGGATLPDPLVEKIKACLAEVPSGDLGVAFSDEEGTLFSHLGDKPLVMQSVYKFPLALAVLAQVDAGKWTLESKFELTEKDLPEGTWSPLREKSPKGGSFALKELLFYTVAESDNNTCDFLFDLLGGPQKVEDFLRKKGIENIKLTYKENVVKAEKSKQYQNVGSPLALNQLLKAFVEEKMVSAQSTRFLMNVMTRTKTGAGRIKGKLPADVAVAHKTGSGFDFEGGGSSALNDVGIVSLPSGERFYVSFLFQDCHESTEKRELLMAELTQWVYEELSKPKKEKTE